MTNLLGLRLELRLESTAEVLAGIAALSPADRAQVSDAWLAQLQAHPPSPWTHAFAVIDRASRQRIGSCGFKGPPDDDGSVEIAYMIELTHRGRGHAKESAALLVAHAWTAGVRTVRAHTLPEAGPSTSVLAACGFRCLGERVDPEDGAVWRWEIAHPA